MTVEWFPIPGREADNLSVSQGATSGDLIVMTQVPQRPDGTMELGSVEDQTRQIMQNFDAELQKVGSDLAHVLNITIYTTKLEEFATIVGVWGEFYPGRGPGRATVGVADLIPKGLAVEMTALAVPARD